MTADAAAPQPGLGDIGCTLILGDVGWLIRLAQFLNKVNWKIWTWRKLWKLARSEHAFVFAGNGEIVEAEPGGARIANLSEYGDRPIVWLRCPDEHRQAVADAARSLEGTPYSAADFFALAAHRFHLPIPGLRHYVEASGHAICSQLADMAAAKGGWVLFADGRWAGYVDPADLAQLAEA